MRFAADALSSRDRRALVFGVVIVAGILGFSFVVPLLRRWSGEAGVTAAALVAAVARADQLLLDGGRTRDSLEQRNGRYLALAPALLDGSSPAGAGATLAGLVSGAAATAGVRPVSIQVRPDSAAAGTFTRVAVRADVEGDVHGIMSLLQVLERGPTLLAVRELSITQPQPAAPSEQMEVLRAHLLVEALALNRRATPAPRGAP